MGVGGWRGRGRSCTQAPVLKSCLGPFIWLFVIKINDDWRHIKTLLILFWDFVSIFNQETLSIRYICSFMILELILWDSDQNTWCAIIYNTMIPFSLWIYFDYLRKKLLQFHECILTKRILQTSISFWKFGMVYKNKK